MAFRRNLRITSGQLSQDLLSQFRQRLKAQPRITDQCHKLCFRRICSFALTCELRLQLRNRITEMVPPAKLKVVKKTWRHIKRTFQSHMLFGQKETIDTIATYFMVTRRLQ